jgi:hypothetical protein
VLPLSLVAHGRSGRYRTSDLPVIGRMLYQLSYASSNWWTGQALILRPSRLQRDALRLSYLSKILPRASCSGISIFPVRAGAEPLGCSQRLLGAGRGTRTLAPGLEDRDATITPLQHWVRGRESHPRLPAYETGVLLLNYPASNWSAPRELHPYALRHWFLRPACLLFHHGRMVATVGLEPTYPKV